MEIKAKDISSRDVLDTLAKTQKPTKITGTTAELKRLFLSHGKQVYGVAVEATDYTPPEVQERPKRGILFDSKLNGNIVIKNAKTNQSRAQ